MEFTNNSLYTFMHKHVHQKNTLLSCCIVPGIENAGDADIHPTLTYTIISIFTIKIRMSNMRRRTVQLVKLRSPWGVVKFKGAWSMLSQAVPKREMRRLGLVSEEEGEFVMSFEDFLRNFTTLTICRLHHNAPKGVTTDSIIPRYAINDFYGSWSIARNTAGGSLNHPDTFPNNPQYLVQTDHACEIMVSLIQKDGGAVDVSMMQETLDESKRISNLSFASSIDVSWIQDSNQTLGIFSPTSQSFCQDPRPPPQPVTLQPSSQPNHQTCGILLLRVEQNRKYKIHTTNFRILHATPYTRSRDSFTRIQIPCAGRFMLLPTTFEPNREGDFLLRVVSSIGSGVKVWECWKDRPGERKVLVPWFGKGRGDGERGEKPYALVTVRRRRYPVGVLKAEVVSVSGVSEGTGIWKGKGVVFVEVGFSEGNVVEKTGRPLSAWAIGILGSVGSGQGKKGMGFKEGIGTVNNVLSGKHASLTVPPVGTSTVTGKPTISPLLRPIAPLSSAASTTSATSTSSSQTLTSSAPTPTQKVHTFLTPFLFPTHNPETASITLTAKSRNPLGLDMLLGSVVVNVSEYAEEGMRDRIWEVMMEMKGKEEEGGDEEVKGAVTVRIRWESSLEFL
ncbi:Calpain-6 [Rhizophlyctis rosea]|uniref:Calpain-6 n=1 Tax=Rhizophlyctis rosea TaxID=64517 RepID=A0AAD5SG95_9FUNG|nr:Calpain-6 [Rhizophlyctis rosea]